MTRRDGVFPLYVAREFTTIERRDQLVERVLDATNRQCAQLRASVSVSGQPLWQFQVIYHIDKSSKSSKTAYLESNGKLLTKQIYTTPVERYRCGAESEGDRGSKFEDSVDFRS